MPQAWEIVLFLAITFISYMFDESECEKGKGVLLIHHALNTFVSFGWLSNNETVLKIYLLSPIVILCNWLSDTREDVLTRSYNEVCSTPGREFQNVFDIMGMQGCGRWLKYGKYLFYILAYLIVLLKLGYLPLKKERK
jgi:hypothetical protein